MMGTKARHFAPLVQVSLEALVPPDHFYRHLERSLDLSFVREFVQQRYAGGGRPSIDPVVFFKLQLVMFFEGIRSERQLMRHAADRLSIRWDLGYDLGEPLPDHSSLTRIRERYGIDVFRRFFEQIVEQCQAAGLVWGKEPQRKKWAVLPMSRRRGRHLRNFPPRSHLRSRSTSPRRIPSGMTGLRSWEHKTAA